MGFACDVTQNILLAYMTAVHIIITNHVFTCSLLHCELKNMCDYTLKLAVFHMLFPINMADLPC